MVSNKKRLEKSIVYLSGAIDRAKDLGKGWREEFIRLSSHLNLRVINPCSKPVSFVHEINGDVRAVNTLREQEKWEELQEFVKKFRREDLRFTDISDFLVVYIDPDVPSYGTLDELFLAEREHKPVLCIIKGGICKLPTWLFGVFRLNEIFSNVQECVDYLDKINSGEIDIDLRWVLIHSYLP